MELDCKPTLVWRGVASAQGRGNVHGCPGVGEAADGELVRVWCYTLSLHSCSRFQLSDAESLNLGRLAQPLV
jgi:hypothetical protein